MNLTVRERTILRLAKHGLSDYKIAREINTDPPSVTRSRKNAHKKLSDALTDLDWALQLNVRIVDSRSISCRKFLFFL
jgi:FixJ family two-component response regulator